MPLKYILGNFNIKGRIDSAQVFQTQLVPVGYTNIINDAHAPPPDGISEAWK